MYSFNPGAPGAGSGCHFGLSTFILRDTELIAINTFNKGRITMLKNQRQNFRSFENCFLKDAGNVSSFKTCFQKAITCKLLSKLKIIKGTNFYSFEKQAFLSDVHDFIFSIWTCFHAFSRDRCFENMHQAKIFVPKVTNGSFFYGEIGYKNFPFFQKRKKSRHRFELGYSHPIRRCIYAPVTCSKGPMIGI